MDLNALLSEREPEVLDEAYMSLQRSPGTHYERAGEEFTRERLEELSTLVIDAIRTRDLAPLSAHTEQVATERFNHGFTISEVQSAFNALEEAMWRRVVSRTPPEELAESIGLLSTVFGFAKDVMARTFVSLASQRHVPTLDLSALFAGTE